MSNAVCFVDIFDESYWKFWALSRFKTLTRLSTTRLNSYTHFLVSAENEDLCFEKLENRRPYTLEGTSFGSWLTACFLFEGGWTLQFHEQKPYLFPYFFVALLYGNRKLYRISFQSKALVRQSRKRC